jgi:hypothetical protein
MQTYPFAPPLQKSGTENGKSCKEIETLHMTSQNISNNRR